MKLRTFPSHVIEFAAEVKAPAIADGGNITCCFPHEFIFAIDISIFTNLCHAEDGGIPIQFSGVHNILDNNYLIDFEETPITREFLRQMERLFSSESHLLNWCKEQEKDRDKAKIMAEKIGFNISTNLARLVKMDVPYSQMDSVFRQMLKSSLGQKSFLKG